MRSMPAFLLLLFVKPIFAQLSWTEKVDMGEYSQMMKQFSPKGINVDEASKKEVYFLNGRKAEHSKDPSGAAKILISDLNQEKIYEVDLNSKTYTESDYSSGLKSPQAELDIRDIEKGTIGAKFTGRSKKINGRDCKEISIKTPDFMNPKASNSGIIWSCNPIPSELIKWKSLEKKKNLISRPLNAKPAFPKASKDLINWVNNSFPIQFSLSMHGMKMGYTLSNINEKPFPKEKIEIPKGFKKVSY